MRTIIAVLFLFILSACSLAQFERNSDLIELTVRAATARVLAENPTWAAPAVAITHEAASLVSSGEIVRLDDLESLIVSRITWAALAPEEQVLLRTLISRVRWDLENRMLQEGIPEEKLPDLKVKVLQVLTWINQTAAVRTG